MSLTVNIYSFGFHASGPPSDPNGNGGGFIFDCRCLPNPGRLEQYRPLTGLDASVKDWLGENPAFQPFANSCLAVVEKSINAYLERGMSHLMVSFGCTGGQHRSVRLSEWLHQRLEERGGISTTLTHTEQNRWPKWQEE